MDGSEPRSCCVHTCVPLRRPSSTYLSILYSTHSNNPFIHPPGYDPVRPSSHFGASQQQPKPQPKPTHLSIVTTNDPTRHSEAGKQHPEFSHDHVRAVRIVWALARDQMSEMNTASPSRFLTFALKPCVSDAWLWAWAGWGTWAGWEEWKRGR
jgi:hypothetical protein